MFIIYLWSMDDGRLAKAKKFYFGDAADAWCGWIGAKLLTEGGGSAALIDGTTGEVLADSSGYRAS